MGVIGSGVMTRPGSRSNFFVGEWSYQYAQPIWLGYNVVIEKGDDISGAVSDASITRAAEAALGLDDIVGLAITGDLACFGIAFGVVNNQNAVWSGGEAGDSCEAFFEEGRAVTSANDYGGGFGVLVIARSFCFLKWIVYW